MSYPYPTLNLRSPFFTALATQGFYNPEPNPIHPAAFRRDHDIARHLENALASKEHDEDSCPFCGPGHSRTASQCRAWVDEALYNPFNRGVLFDKWIVRYGYALAEARTALQMLDIPWIAVFLSLLREEERAALKAQLPVRALEMLPTITKNQEQVDRLPTLEGSPQGQANEQPTMAERTREQVALWLATVLQEDRLLHEHSINDYRFPLGIFSIEVAEGKWTKSVTQLDELRPLIRQIADELHPLPVLGDVEVAPSGFFMHRDAHGTFRIGCGNDSVQTGRLKGFRHIYHLLQNPRQAIHSSTLQAMADGRMEKGKTIGEIIDEVTEEGWSVDSTAVRDLGRNPLTVANCRQRLKDIETELELDPDCNDPERRTELRETRDQLRQYLSGITRRDGAPREDAGQANTDRSAVKQTISAAQKWIREEAQGESSFLLPLFEHLEASITTGTFCIYEPAQPLVLHLG